MYWWRGYASPSPLEGEGWGGRAADAAPYRMFRWRMDMQNNLGSNRRKLRQSCGIDCAACRSAAFGSAGRRLLGPTSSISFALTRDLSSKLMAASTRINGATTTGEPNGWKNAAKGCCVFGTMKCWKTWRVFSRKSNVQPRSPPHPKPPPPGGRECYRVVAGPAHNFPCSANPYSPAG